MAQGLSTNMGPGPGDTVAGYALRRALAAGASATVYLAEDTVSGAWAALKLMHTAGDLSDDERHDLRQRFQQEAQMVRRLDHPGIVRILDAGEDHGRLWVAMEAVPGCTLQRYIDKSRLLPPAVVIDIVRQLADALAHAHDAGIVHRDLKPSNVLVDLPSGSVKLTDFGIARFDDGSRTRTGVMLGTPSYMAPEQLAGTAVDARADLYALGVLLFELLTGRRPHESASMGDFLRAVMADPAPDLREHWPAAPPQLAALVTALLAKLASARPVSARDVADTLARVRLHMG
jgi:serine/threonine-protein kinase